MGELNLGSGTSRVLDVGDYNWDLIVHQEEKPPMDAEQNLMRQLCDEDVRHSLLHFTYSGWTHFDTSTGASGEGFRTDGWTNYFYFGFSNPQFASINGKIFKVLGANYNGVANKITVTSSPIGSNRYDFVFLEVFRALISADPSTTNKPSATTVYKYGNVQYGGANLSDDLLDPVLITETAKRVQWQYRIRIVEDIDKDTYPKGFTSSSVLAQGVQGSPVATYTFTKGSSHSQAAQMPWGFDAQLYVAGTGSTGDQTALGTVDGYAYAVPLCYVLRKDSDDTVIESDITDLRENTTPIKMFGADLVELNMLRPDAQATPNSTVYVNPGRYIKTDGTGSVYFTGGNSASFDPKAVSTRVDLLCLDNTGALTIVKNTVEDGNPPTYPTSSQVIAEVTISESGTAEISTDDIIDCRQFLNVGKLTGSLAITGTASATFDINEGTSSPGDRVLRFDTAGMTSDRTIAGDDFVDLDSVQTLTNKTMIHDRSSHSDLRPTEQTVPNNTIAIAAGTFKKTNGTGSITYAGGNSPAFSAKTANDRKDLLCMNDSGTALIVKNTVEDGNPPTYPDDMLVIAEVLITETSVAVISTSDINDVRPFLSNDIGVELFAVPQDTADNTVYVNPGTFLKIDGSGCTTYAGGNSPAFDPISAATRVDLLYITDAGTLTISKNVTEDGNPPAYPQGVTVIAEITITEAGTAIISRADIKNIRPHVTSQKSVYVSGTITFNSTTGQSITHNLGNADHTTIITPVADPAGYLGEIWVTKGANSDTVYNSGTAVTNFDWSIIVN